MCEHYKNCLKKDTKKKLFMPYINIHITVKKERRNFVVEYHHGVHEEKNLCLNWSVCL